MTTRFTLISGTGGLTNGVYIQLDVRTHDFVPTVYGANEES